MLKNRAAIVMYHYVRNFKASRYPEIKGLDLSLFKEQLDFLANNFHFITCDELLGAVEGSCQLPQKSVLLTFDDGYIDHYTNVFPLLKERKIQGFFSMPGKILAERKLLDVNKIHFILASTAVKKLLPMVFERLDHYRGSEFTIPANDELYNKLAQPSRFDTAETIFVKRLLQVELDESLRNIIVDDLFSGCIDLPEEAFAQELYMSMEQVELMQREGMCFGIHGYDHYWLNRLKPQELERDISKSLEVFGEIIPKRWICCYPYGSYSDDVIAYVKTKGAVAGLGTDVRIANLAADDSFKLPRLDTNDLPPKSERYKEFDF